MMKFSDSGHPVCRATSPLSGGTQESKGGGKLSIHFFADGETIETVFHTSISVNQLSIHGAVSDLCEEYKACHVSAGRLVLAGHYDPLFVPTSSLMETLTPSTDVPAHEDLLQKYWKGFHNKIVWLSIVLMQDSWLRFKSDSTSWQSTLKSSLNLQNQRHVVSTLAFEGIPKLGPC